MDRKRLQNLIFVVLFVGVSILTFFIFQPFFHILILAGVLAVLFQPAYKKLMVFFGGGKNILAIVVVFIALVFFILPFLFFGLQLFGQAQNFFAMTGSGEHMLALQHSVETTVRHVVPNFVLNVSDITSRILGYLSNNIGALLSQTASLFLQIMFLLFTFFFFLRDGETLLASLTSLSPFEKEQTKEIMHSLYSTITSVIRGTLFVGLIRWIIFALGFYLFGIQNPLLWASIAGIIGVVPGLGTPFALVPAVIYLFVSGNALLAVAIALFGTLVIIFIDNMLSAYFFKKVLNAPPVFILFSIIGGVFYFGPLGFIFGPIILSLFVSVLDMYKILILKDQ